MAIFEVYGLKGKMGISTEIANQIGSLYCQYMLLIHLRLLLVSLF